MPDTELRTQILQLRISPDHLALIDAAAKCDGRTRSDWLRRAADAQLGRQQCCAITTAALAEAS